MSGFAVVACQRYQIGDMVQTVFRYSGKEYRGSVCIRSVKELTLGRLRYGVICIKKGGAGDDLFDGLSEITMGVQREQLQRLSGAAG